MPPAGAAGFSFSNNPPFNQKKPDFRNSPYHSIAIINAVQVAMDVRLPEKITGPPASLPSTPPSASKP